jgi:hypothetical protein
MPTPLRKVMEVPGLLVKWALDVDEMFISCLDSVRHPVRDGLK